MGRRVHVVAALLLAGATAGAVACGGGRERGKGAGKSGGDAGAAVAVGPRASGPTDAAPADEIDAAPVAPGDVLEGSAAEQAAAEAGMKDGGGAAEVKLDEPWFVTSDGVGPFKLGLPLQQVVQLVGDARLVRRLPTPAGAPRQDEALLYGATGPWLKLKLYAGRLTEIDVLQRDGRALSDEGIGVGSSYEEGVVAHGEARAVVDGKSGKRRGWVLADLPGVLWVPARAPVARAAVDAGADDEALPAPEQRIGQVVVLGVEALAAPD